MGKIKIKLVKRTSGNLAKRDLPFNESFENNKRILGSNTMPGKKIRNQVAGMLARTKRREMKAKQENSIVVN
jgi:ribosomal protein S17E